jgi:hypothetical protein
LIFWYFELKLLSLLGFKPNFEKRDYPDMVISNPFSGPNSEIILKGLQNNTPDSLKNISVTKKDRKVISEYLSTYLQYHFDGIMRLKSFEVLKQVMA